MVEFKEELHEDGEVWAELLVKTDKKDWHYAEEWYPSTDKDEIRKFIRMTEACDGITERFNDWLKLHNTDFSLKPFGDCNSYDCPWGVFYGENSITIMANPDFDKFEVGYATYDSGSYWEPPSSDYVVHSTEDSLFKALLAAYALYNTDSFGSYNMGRWEEDHVEEVEEEY